ncbi:hypothetical protein ROJ8625_03724 [Roseivivax jejudonensis]|uniref:DUF2852 domain-containing protein n=1 Tax=Roseivivax jejudonensis TaxID=1529041 RepID=A0A1X7A6H1_9RHOB|nr:DUF2852 domain-containing protein [Roseivivax jejudonensis]SLN71392.1 hypothetical protein ROJ8625_03724 [Roseivivax jejudonensis]
MMEFTFFPAFLFAAFLMLTITVPMAVFAWTILGRGRGPMWSMPMPWRMMRGPFGMGPCAFGRHEETKRRGNSAFDAYRDETLARLDEEAKAFDAYRARLREARDRDEFDRFMDERKGSQR